MPFAEQRVLRAPRAQRVDVAAGTAEPCEPNCRLLVYGGGWEGEEPQPRWCTPWEALLKAKEDESQLDASFSLADADADAAAGADSPRPQAAGSGVGKRAGAEGTEGQWRRLSWERDGAPLPPPQHEQQPPEQPFARAPLAKEAGAAPTPDGRSPARGKPVGALVTASAATVDPLGAAPRQGAAVPETPVVRSAAQCEATAVLAGSHVDALCPAAVAGSSKPCSGEGDRDETESGQDGDTLAPQLPQQGTLEAQQQQQQQEKEEGTLEAQQQQQQLQPAELMHEDDDIVQATMNQTVPGTQIFLGPPPTGPLQADLTPVTETLMEEAPVPSHLAPTPVAETLLPEAEAVPVVDAKRSEDVPVAGEGKSHVPACFQATQGASEGPALGGGGIGFNYFSQEAPTERASPLGPPLAGGTRLHPPVLAPHFATGADVVPRDFYGSEEIVRDVTAVAAPADFDLIGGEDEGQPRGPVATVIQADIDMIHRSETADEGQLGERDLQHLFANAVSSTATIAVSLPLQERHPVHAQHMQPAERLLEARPPPTSGFMTGSNRPVAVSADTMAAARARLGADFGADGDVIGGADGTASGVVTPMAPSRPRGGMPKVAPHTAPPQQPQQRRPLAPRNALSGKTPQGAKSLARSAAAARTPATTGTKRRAAFKTPGVMNPTKAARQAPHSAPAAPRPVGRQPLFVPRHGPRMSLAQAFGSTGRSLLRAPLACMTSTQARSFIFGMGRFGLGPENAYRQMLMHGADDGLLQQEWVCNAWRWIVWKLAMYDCLFSDRMSGPALSQERVMEQLCFRYEREVAGSARPALRKICEHDLPAGTFLTLRIARVVSLGEAGGGAVVEVTDGWYGVLADLDQLLADRLRDGRLGEGDKLNMCGATLVGSAAAAPAPPLDRIDERVLSLQFNSVRPARWDALLGQKPPGVRFMVPVRSCQPNGGPIPATRVVVVRVLPPIFVEKLPDGASIFRSERAEDFAAEAHRNRVNDAAEQETAAAGPGAPERSREELNEAIERRLGGPIERDTYARMSVMVMAAPRRPEELHKPFQIEVSISNASEELRSLLCPGAGFMVNNLMPATFRKQAQLKTSKGTAWLPWEGIPPAVAECARTLSLPSLAWEIHKAPTGVKVDVVGVLVHAGTPCQGVRGETSQWAFFAVVSPLHKECELFAVEFVDGAAEGFSPFGVARTKKKAEAQGGASAPPVVLLRRVEMLSRDRQRRMMCGRASARDGATHEPASVVAGEAVAKTCAQCVHWVASEQGKHALVAMRAHVQSILSTSDEGQQE